MAKALTDEQRKLRLELVELAAQGIRNRAERDNYYNHYYTPEQVTYLTQQLERVAKFLCVKN